MITIIFGDPGDGKTALMTHFAYIRMVQEGYDYWWKSCQRIDLLKRGGFSRLEYLPQQHTVYADYVIKNGWGTDQSYYVNGFSIALPNPFFQTTFFAPYSQIFLDEAQKYYDSRMSKYLRECVYRFYQLHRHNHLDVFMTCQRLGNIDLNIRQISGRFILCKGCKTKEDEYGRIESVKIKYVEFDSMSDAEAYYENGKTNVKCEEKHLDIDYNVFELYDSYGNEPVFYDGNYNRKFDCYTEEGYVDTVESYMLYNKSHMYYAPVGYWKNEKRDAEILKKMSA